MPEYLTPGVYVEEVAAGPVPIEGVSTTTTGFVGQTARGGLAARLVTSWPQYQRWYGGYINAEVSYLPFAVKGFFDNGGQRAFIARVAPAGAGTAEATFGGGGQGLRVRAIGPGAWGGRIFVRIGPSRQLDPDGTPVGFRVTVLYYAETPPLPLVDPLDVTRIRDADRREPAVVEDFDNLRPGPREPNYAEVTINSSSHLVEVSWADPDAPPARPDDADYTVLAGGEDGPAPATAQDYLGGAQPQPDPLKPVLVTGLAAIRSIDEVALLCVPDEAAPVLGEADRSAVRDEMINQCAQLQDRFAVLSVPRGAADVGSIQKPVDSSFAAVYYPWVRVLDTRTGMTLLVPPAGHVTGIYARVDVERGVFKAPANEVVRGIVTADLGPATMPLEFRIGKEEQAVLNPNGINVIRDFRPDGRGIRVWGARTLSSDPQWKYVNVRRLFLYVEESIDEGTQWVVFEPNDDTTWARVVRGVSNFLTTVWRSGALLGTTADEAFFVRCDRTTMGQDDLDNGRMVVLIGIAPVKPAEFVIFRISQKTAEEPA